MSAVNSRQNLGARDTPNETTADRTALPSVRGNCPDR